MINAYRPGQFFENGKANRDWVVIVVPTDSECTETTLCTVCGLVSWETVREVAEAIWAKM